MEDQNENAGLDAHSNFLNSVLRHSLKSVEAHLPELPSKPS